MSSPAGTGRATPRSAGLRIVKIAGVGVVIVLALVALLTALRTELPRSPGVMSDSLGPENGELVDDYLARAAGSLDGDGDDDDGDSDSASASDGGRDSDGNGDAANGDAANGDVDADAPRWALITAGWAWTVPEAAGVVRELPRVSGLYVQVPVDGVAMPVTGVTLAEPVAGEAGREPVFDRGLRNVVQRLDGVDPAGPGVPSPPDAGRAAATNALTVSRLRSGAPAIVGLLARGTPAQLRAVAEQPWVRAVEALPADAVWERFAVRPLQPQQVDAASPLPDDAPVPPT
ncbi:hypothetical protein [Dietzia psychralcaliphila]|uniref:hypothetical protein n=2 Tax=Dietzia psychralcaliphila TaxID=139021 RepID=UPI000D498F3A|nr:hypothetical protein [Dietzia psychralcaliphila]PTM87422.1 hypothetical protein C8N39_105254 [Dietzia psychralcaliphila]